MSALFTLVILAFVVYIIWFFVMLTIAEAQERSDKNNF